MLMERPASMSSTEQSMKVVSEVPVKFPMRSIL